MLPLEGITVVSLEQAVAAPFASRQLADMGARVIKVERPGGGDFARRYDGAVHGMASYFAWLNRSKESLALDLKQPEAVRALRRLIEGADVFIQNLAPGSAGRLGLTSLRENQPSLITCTISGYGAEGPFAAKKAYDLLIQCETGVLSVTGTPETPSKTGISVADIAAGMYGFSGILLALFTRERTGEGSHLEVSLFDALAEWMSQPALFARYSGMAPPRTGASHATIAPYGPFPTGDGKAVFLSVQNEREWERFCKQVLGRPELVDDSRFSTNAARMTNRAEVGRLVNEAFSSWTASDTADRLEAAGIANATLREPEDLWSHPQVLARHRLAEVESPHGPFAALLPPITMAGVEPRMEPIPAPGTHTAAILQGLGYSAAEIERMSGGPTTPLQ
jgi:itaconate CoA-transferase